MKSNARRGKRTLWTDKLHLWLEVTRWNLGKGNWKQARFKPGIMRLLKIRNLDRHTAVREQILGMEQTRALSSLSFADQVARLIWLPGRREVRGEGKLLQRLTDPGTEHHPSHLSGRQRSGISSLSTAFRSAAAILLNQIFLVLGEITESGSVCLQDRDPDDLARANSLSSLTPPRSPMTPITTYNSLLSLSHLLDSWSVWGIWGQFTLC